MVHNCTLLLTRSPSQTKLSVWLDGAIRVGDVSRVQVLLRAEEALRFERFCQQLGHKKSTLIARLIREHLDRHGFEMNAVVAQRRAVG